MSLLFDVGNSCSFSLVGRGIDKLFRGIGGNLSIGGAYHVFLMKYGQFIHDYTFETEWEANRYVAQVNDDPYYGINSGNWDGYHAYLRGEY